MSDLSDDQPPGLEIFGEVATLTLRRPSKHNRIAPEDSEIITGHLVKLELLTNIRVLIITGTGDKTFSSGYTLNAIKGELDRRFEDMLDRIERFPLPIICALNGSVYGGATDLALCCDFRIGVFGSRILMPSSKIGVHYYPGGIRRYIALLGLATAKKLFLTGQSIEDAEALRVGFLHELVTPDQLMSVVRKYCDSILECAPKVLATMKCDLMDQAYHQVDEQNLRAHYEESLKSPELAARLFALENKRRG